MAGFTWKILEVSADGELITHAKYQVIAEDEDGTTVETEGNWWFKNLEISKPFDKVTELDVAGWIEEETTQDGKNSIKLRLEEQLAYLKKNRVVVAPWMPQIFTPNL